MKPDFSFPRWLFLAGLILAGLVVTLIPIGQNSLRPQERYFRLEAAQFRYTPEVLHVNTGDHITIDLVATDVVHGLMVDGYDAAVSADPGQTARLQFTADKPGSFRFRCTVTCGNMHPFMIGKLVVGSNVGLWRAAGLAFLALLGVWILHR